MKPPITGTCRCGHDGVGEHPCHADDYTCRKPAKQRFYNPRPVALAGAQMKLEVCESWACDAHWTAFQAQIKAFIAAQEALLQEIPQ